MTERAVAFTNSQGKRLHGVLCQGPTTACLAVVMCYPFTDERKCAQRAYVTTARALAQASVPSLRFDYSGCGNSEGRFEEATLGAWVADTVRAFEFVQAMVGGWVLAMGLRLGANIALEAANQHKGCRRLLLWNLLADTSSCVAAGRRQMLIRRMLDTCHGEPGDQGRNGGKYIDLAGYAASKALVQELRHGTKVDLTTVAADPRVQLGIVSPEPSLAGDEVANHGEPLMARSKAFWRLSEVRDITEFVETTVRHVVGVTS